MKHRLALWAVIASLRLATLLSAQPALRLVEKAIDLSHPVDNINASDVATQLASRDGADLVFFDVRKLEEFATSHLAHAIHIDPDMSAETFTQQYGSLITGKDLVLYCSVGYRSAILLERIRQPATAAGAHSVSNLRGGIFRWYNEGHPVVDVEGETDKIHPYDRKWGRLVTQRVTAPD